MCKYDTADYHYHYCDVLTGYSYAKNNGECTDDSIEKLEEIETEPIISYMTEDEIIKAMNGQLDDEDITNIIYRINHSKVKTLS